MENHKNKKILELGCGRKPYKPKEGEVVVHLDKVKLPDVEVVWDLNKFPWPFKDNEFDVVIASHVLEHLDNLIRVMEEIQRITKPGGLVKIKVPYAKHSDAFTDPTHKHFFTSFTFDYWDESKGLFKLHHEFSTKAKFKVVKKKLNFPRPFRFLSFLFRFKKGFAIYESLLSGMFPAYEIEFELEVIK